MIKNIIIRSNKHEFDFQAQGFDPEVLEVYRNAISYINPVTGKVDSHACDIAGDCAIVSV